MSRGHISLEWNVIIISLLQELGFKADESMLSSCAPPDGSFGDIAYPMFIISKVNSCSPNEMVVALIDFSEKKALPGTLHSSGPYVNIKVNRAFFAEKIMNSIEEEKDQFGYGETFVNQRIMIEFSGPNTNKPLHVGHLRNNVLGESLSRIFKFCGATVQKVNIINDRGVHICKSMLAYQLEGERKNPEELGKKSDHFVGDYYVRYSQLEKNNKALENDVQQMLLDWERGDAETLALWKQMNEWAISGIKETYARTDISFDTYYFESEHYQEGRQAVLDGLANGLFYKEENGSVLVDLSTQKLDKKVLLRGDSTSLYITQDLGLAYKRYADWPFDSMMYVVAHEQNYHFKVLFSVLRMLGFVPAQKDAMQHVGYGMVHLPEGKLKSREGRVVDGDELIDNLVDKVRKEMDERSREASEQKIVHIAEKVAIGALHYYLLSVHPKKDMVFDIRSSIEFQGNTGPYLQYTGARISTMIKKFSLPNLSIDYSLFEADEEWELVLLLDKFAQVVHAAAVKLDPSLLAHYLYQLASKFSKFYHSNPIAKAEDKKIAHVRMRISMAIRQVLENGAYLLNIPFLEEM